MYYKKLGFVFLIFASNFLLASIDDYFLKKVEPTSSNYGITGILQLPNARFMDEAMLRFTFSSSFPNEFTSITASPFPWFEATYRYVEVKNRKYGPSSFSGNQSWKDKGFDTKFRILKEGLYMPAIAIGFRDLAGTGAFSSEYLVATKALGNFDLTLGLGWGVLGSESSISTPLSSLHDSFKVRDASSEYGGSFNYKDWLSGDAAILAGLEYNMRRHGLRLKLEYDTSNPHKDKFNPTPIKSRFNFGVNYYLAESLDLGLAFERGDQFRISFALKGDFFKDTIGKPPAKNVVKLSREQSLKARNEPMVFYGSLNKSLRDESIYIQGASYKEDSVEVIVASSKFTKIPIMVGRSARIVSALSDENVKEIDVRVMNGDYEVSVVSIDREELDKAVNKDSTVNEILEKSNLFSNSGNPGYRTTLFQPTINFPEFEWNMAPAFRHQIGGPEGFYLGQLWWRTNTSLKLSRGLALYTSFGIDIYNTFDKFINKSRSELPHVRSDIQDYLEQGKNNIERMQLEYMFSPYKDVFIRTDLGLLEEMFAGYGGEVLYRPFEKNYSIGFSAHRVYQREYKQRFGLLGYETDTGHLTLYYDFPYGIASQFSMGKYLAGDKGVTLDLSRRFDSGFIVGVFASKTNIPTELFGEGSFDKGFYFSIPLDLFYADYQASAISFGLHPLTKDAASKLYMHNSLFSILGTSNRSFILRDWDDLLN